MQTAQQLNRRTLVIIRQQSIGRLYLNAQQIKLVLRLASSSDARLWQRLLTHRKDAIVHLI